MKPAITPFRLGVVALAMAMLLPTSVTGTTIATGYEHTVVVTPDGTVWTWGGNTQGQLGDGTTQGHQVPAAVPVLSGVTAVAAGQYHTLILKSDGTVWAWGSNTYGQLGDGTQTRRLDPVSVIGLSGVIAIAAGATVFITECESSNLPMGSKYQMCANCG